MNILQRSLREHFPRLFLLLSSLLLVVPRINRCLSPVEPFRLVGQDCRPVQSAPGRGLACSGSACHISP